MVMFECPKCGRSYSSDKNIVCKKCGVKLIHAINRLHLVEAIAEGRYNIEDISPEFFNISLLMARVNRLKRHGGMETDKSYFEPNTFNNQYTICPHCGKQYDNGQIKCVKCNSPVVVYAEYNKLVNSIYRGEVLINDIDSDFFNTDLLRKKVSEAPQKMKVLRDTIKRTKRIKYKYYTDFCPKCRIKYVFARNKCKKCGTKLINSTEYFTLAKDILNDVIQIEDIDSSEYNVPEIVRHMNILQGTEPPINNSKSNFKVALIIILVFFIPFLIGIFQELLSN